MSPSSRTLFSCGGYGRGVLSRWPGGLAALVVTLLTSVLVIGEITDRAMRRWWAGHALTTGTVSGLLVLLITLLVVDQVVMLRQLSARARAVAAQAAIIMTQAVRASRSVSQAVAQGADEGDHDAAADEFRTYMMMLLVGAPVLIDAKVSRSFLEQAQTVGGLMARALGVTARPSAPGTLADTRLDDAVQQLRVASAPLLAVLDPETQAAVRGDESALRARKWSHLGKAQRRAITPPARLPPSLGRYGDLGVAGIGRLRGGRAAPGGDP